MKNKMQAVILIDIRLDEIKEIDKTLDAFAEHMTEEEFNNSKDVEKLYKRLEEIGLDLFYAED